MEISVAIIKTLGRSFLQHLLATSQYWMGSTVVLESNFFLPVAAAAATTAATALATPAATAALLFNFGNIKISTKMILEMPGIGPGTKIKTANRGV